MQNQTLALKGSSILHMERFCGYIEKIRNAVFLVKLIWFVICPEVQKPCSAVQTKF